MYGTNKVRRYKINNYVDPEAVKILLTLFLQLQIKLNIPYNDNLIA